MRSIDLVLDPVKNTTDDIAIGTGAIQFRRLKNHINGKKAQNGERNFTLARLGSSSNQKAWYDTAKGRIL